MAKEISGRGRRRRHDEKGNQGVGDFCFINILPIFSILSFFFLYFFYPRHLPTPTLTTHDLYPLLEARRILRVVSHFNLSVLANETLSVSLSLEIDNVSGAVRTCFDHVLSKFSGFSWERILFLKSACVNMVMQIQVQIGDNKRVFL